eukprot:532773-Rhodomonas_salina.1
MGSRALSASGVSAPPPLRVSSLTAHHASALAIAVSSVMPKVRKNALYSVLVPVRYGLWVDHAGPGKLLVRASA